MPGYSQLARLEPTVFRRRSRRLQLTSLEQLPKSKTANLITSSALRWERPVNGITSMRVMQRKKRFMRLTIDDSSRCRPLVIERADLVNLPGQAIREVSITDRNIFVFSIPLYLQS